MWNFSATYCGSRCEFSDVPATAAVISDILGKVHQFLMSPDLFFKLMP